MAFEIAIVLVAQKQLEALPTRDRRILERVIPERLSEEPRKITRAIKKLRPNPFAEFELRIGDLRVFYNVEGEEVVVLSIGRKVRNKLIVDGVEFHAHQDDSTQQPGTESPGDA